MCQECGCENHDSKHSHEYNHNHNNKEEHSHEHKEEHSHEHKEEHSHEHKEEHSHEHKEEHSHEHKEEHSHEHKEKHSHTDEYAHHENIIVIEKSVTQENDEIAQVILDEMKNKKILSINLQGAPGSGKTTFIEGISNYISPAEIFVIQGDLESDIDKERLFKSGIDAYQINTHSGCHLNANMVFKALKEIDLTNKKYLIIENVGNLVCPAGIKIGQHMNLVVSSTTEGSDKPKKYPIIFLDAKLIIISKSDLADAVDFDENQYITDIKNINSKVKIIKTTRKIPESFSNVAHYLEHEREHLIKNKHEHENKTEINHSH